MSTCILKAEVSVGTCCSVLFSEKGSAITTDASTCFFSDLFFSTCFVTSIKDIRLFDSFLSQNAGLSFPGTLGLGQLLELPTWNVAHAVTNMMKQGNKLFPQRILRAFEFQKSDTNRGPSFGFLGKCVNGFFFWWILLLGLLRWLVLVNIWKRVVFCEG